MTTDTSSTGRPATFSRDDAINRAMNLFWRDGYLAVTARDLASAMDIQRSSFYNSFGNKEIVFSEALKAYTQQAPDSELDDIQVDQPVIPAIVTTLQKLCRERIADKEARGCLICNSVAELVGVDESLGPTLQRAVKHRIGVMELLFTQAVNQGEFEPTTTVADIAKSFVSFLLGINVASKTIRSESDLWSICRTFLLGIGVEEQELPEPA